MPRDKYDKYDSPNPRRTHTFMSAEDVAAGKKSTWTELEITGKYRCIDRAGDYRRGGGAAVILEAKS
jgi:hypothetical protein